MSTHHVDIGSFSDQAGYHVFTKRPSSHVQGCHPAAVDRVDISTMADQDLHRSLGHVAYAQVESSPSFHLGRNQEKQIFCYLSLVRVFFKFYTWTRSIN